MLLRHGKGAGGILISAEREVEGAVGAVRYGPSPSEGASLGFRRSLFVVRDIRAGEMLTRDNVRAIRPGAGLEPRHLDRLLGRPAKVDLPRGTPLTWEVVEGASPAEG